MPAPLSGDLRERIVAAIRWEFDARGSRAVFGEPILGHQVDGAVSRDWERGTGPLWWTPPADLVAA
jgi:hypothetical protein